MKAKASKFEGLLKASDPKVKKSNSKPKESNEVSTSPRTIGKRSDPDFEQVTAYIRKITYRDVKIALLQQGRDKEFSDLVEELLAKWLGSKK